MSFEHFQELGAEGHSKSVEMSRQRGISPTETLANILIDSGKSALTIYADSMMDHKAGILYDTPEFWENMYDRHPQDIGAIATGMCLIGLEQSLLDKRFSTQEFQDLWNYRIIGLPFLRVDDPDEGYRHWTEDFSPVHWNMMLELARRDPSLTSFFEPNNGNLLPIGLQDFIEQQNLNPLMKEPLAEYKKIIGSQTKKPLQLREITHHQRALEEADNTIAKAQHEIDAMLEARFADALQRQDQEITGALQELPTEHIAWIDVSNTDSQGVTKRITNPPSLREKLAESI